MCSLPTTGTSNIIISFISFFKLSCKAFFQENSEKLDVNCMKTRCFSSVALGQQTTGFYRMPLCLLKQEKLDIFMNLNWIKKSTWGCQAGFVSFLCLELFRPPAHCVFVCVWTSLRPPDSARGRMSGGCGGGRSVIRSGRWWDRTVLQRRGTLQHQAGFEYCIRAPELSGSSLPPPPETPPRLCGGGCPIIGPHQASSALAYQGTVASIDLELLLTLLTQVNVKLAEVAPKTSYM